MWPLLYMWGWSGAGGIKTTCKTKTVVNKVYKPIKYLKKKALIGERNLNGNLELNGNLVQRNSNRVKIWILLFIHDFSSFPFWLSQNHVTCVDIINLPLFWTLLIGMGSIAIKKVNLELNKTLIPFFTFS